MLLSLFFIIISSPSLAKVITVGKEPGHDYSIIQEAITSSENGDEIIVLPGVYEEDINFDGENIILRSLEPTSETLVNQTVISGSIISDSIVTFKGDEMSSCVLSGFTISRGHDSKKRGIDGNGCHAKIEYNWITKNYWEGGDGIAADGGGGIKDCDGVIQYNRITDNLLVGDLINGGGLAFCDGVIRHNIIQGNQIGHKRFSCMSDANFGGGLYACHGIIEYNEITSNTVFSYIGGGGGGLSHCNGIIYKNLISSNVANEENDPYYSDGGGALYECRALIIENIISENKSPYHGAVKCPEGFIFKNVISKNSAGVSGGGIILNNLITHNGYGAYFAHGEIRNNIIAFNSYGAYCSGIIENNLIYRNWAGVVSTLGYTKVFKNNIVWENHRHQIKNWSSYYHEDVKPEFCCIQDWEKPGGDNITSAPLFMNPGENDFRLQEGSPCIDAGDPDPAYNDRFMPPGKGSRRCDMGPYGGPWNFDNPIPVIVTEHILGNFKIYPAHIQYFDFNKDAVIDVCDLLLSFEETEFQFP